MGDPGNQNLKEHYQNLYTEAIQCFENDRYQIDTLIDDPLDKRFGITLLIRLPDRIKTSIIRELEKVERIEPNQYFYPMSDLHITVMSIISCYNGFELSSINMEEYDQIIKKCLVGVHEFKIHLKGMTASPSCLMISGFYDSQTLSNIRESLRINFKNSGLEQTLDKRYAIQTAHATIFRIKAPFANRSQLVEIISGYKDHDFGTFEVDTLELVYNDWYQREKHVKLLQTFRLS